MGDHVLYVMSTVLNAQDNLIDQTEQFLDEIEQVIETVRGIKKTPPSNRTPARSIAGRSTRTTARSASIR
jgi:hypothetical protein